MDLASYHQDDPALDTFGGTWDSAFVDAASYAEDSQAPAREVAYPYQRDCNTPVEDAYHKAWVAVAAAVVACLDAAAVAVAEALVLTVGWVAAFAAEEGEDLLLLGQNSHRHPLLP